MKKAIIKISHLTVWEGDYIRQSPNKSSMWDGNKFEIQNNAQQCDFWIIHEGISEIETAFCNKKNCILIIGEEKSKKDYDPLYLNQFGAVITTRDDLKHHNIIKWHYICPWHVKKTYNDLNLFTKIEKSKVLSSICSNSTYTEGQKKRYAFVNKIIGHFKDEINAYGRGYDYVIDKFDGLAPYKYSIAIENSVFPDYWTEKIMDCYLSLTMPIYYGCPNIYDFFPKESLIAIDINDYKNSILTIEQAIEEKYYEKYFEQIAISKNLILNKYQILPAILEIIKENQDKFSFEKGETTILPERYFPNDYKKVRARYKLKRIIKKIV
jgi:hypothetical protein